MNRIETHAHLMEALDALVRLDGRLKPVRERAGQIPLRRAEPGFASLVSIIISQQVSRASAEAIERRLVQAIRPLTPRALLAGGETALIAAGLSRAKQRTVLALSQAIENGELNFETLELLDGDEAIALLTNLPGIGPWTAQVYLLVSAGHPDIFPAGDVALQAAVADALSLSSRPDTRTMARIAESWSPFRAAAARLFWAHYRGMKGKEAAPMPVSA